VLTERVVTGQLVIDQGRITDVLPLPDDDRAPLLAPGFIDVHVHGFGGHDAMAGPGAIAGMARALLGHGVTAVLPTAVSSPMDRLAAFAADAREVTATAPPDGARVLGFNLEGPCLAPSRRGAHDAAHLRAPAELDDRALEPLVDGLRVMTVAPELPGALALIGRLARRGVVVSLGHSDATADQARAGYAAGARATTHLFNAMSGLDHRRPGLPAAALADDAVTVELIADGHHVDSALWPLVWRTKPADRVVLVSDASAAAGAAGGRARLGDAEVVARDGRAVIAGSDTLAGSVIGLDDAVRNLVDAGASLPLAVAAATRNPARLLGDASRGEIAPGRRADLVELDDDLRVTGVWLGGRPV